MMSVVRDVVGLPFGLNLSRILAGVRDASQAILDIYDKQSSDFNIQTKSDDSPVTSADLASDAVLRSMLEEVLPFGADAIVSEEHAISHARAGRLLVTGKPVVFVDPLDGTKEFIKRSGQFVINIGIVENEKSVFGLIHAPVNGETLIGWKHRDDSAGTILTVTGRSKERPAIESEAIVIRNVALGQSDKKNEAEGNADAVPARGGRVYKLLLSGSAPPDQAGFVSVKNILEQAGIAVRIIRMGSALKFCRITDGSADIYLRRAPTYYWDTVSGQALVDASGGSMYSLSLNWKDSDGANLFEPFEYRDRAFMNPGFAVFGATVSQSERSRILRALNDHLRNNP
jgi:3'(2'), 5'-bisphosphate nucleotidase